MTATLTADSTTGVINVCGHVDWDDCETLRDAGVAAIEAAADSAAAGTGVRFDLSALERAESRVVAVMLAWLRAGHTHDCSVTFVDLPEPLRRIVDFTGLDEVFEAQVLAGEPA